jgi:hypothetical protein
VTPFAPEDFRPSIESGAQRFSSPAAQPDDGKLPQDQTAELAARLGSSERALGTANGMLQRHLGRVGEGQAGQFTATLNGIRRARLRAPGLMARGPDLSVGVAFLADPLVLLIVGTPEQRSLHWSLLPGGSSVTARADGLRFLRGLAAGGQLTFQTESRDALPPLDVEGDRWDDEDEWRLFEDLAALEEWSGATLPMPKVVSAEEATIAAQAASWSRTQQLAAHLTDVITFVAKTVAFDEANDLLLHQEFGVELFGVEVPLGDGAARVRLRRVESESAPTQGPRTYRAWPARSELTFWLSPPQSRRLPARRTQPDHLSPGGQPKAEESVRLSFVRPARRRLKDVLTARRRRETAPARHIGGTTGLLDDVRGE